MSSHKSNPTSQSGASWALLLTAAMLLYAAALAPRMWGAFSQETQADEIHWQSRSYAVVKVLKSDSGNGQQWKHFSDHLGHPGVPPALIMAAAEFAGDKLNRARGLQFGQAGYIDHLGAARLANAAVSSLVVPLVFLVGASLLGVVPALFGALLLVCDPVHIGLSRMAHLDSMLTLFSTAAFLFFALAEKRNSLPLHITAGIAWGLAIATKPTAAALVVGFLLYRMKTSPVLGRLSAEEKRPFFLWRDVWAVIVGQLVLAALCTRLWVHPSQYLTRLKVDSAAADWLYEAGLAVQSALFGGPAAAAGAAAAILLLAWTARRCTSRWIFHGAMAALAAAAAMVFMGLFPPVPENLLRFWGWVAGLSEEVHKAYGRTIEPLPYGYAGILFRRLPELLLAGLLLAGVQSLVLHHAPSEKGRTFQGMVFLTLVTALSWLLLLGVSDKQTMRYAAPLLPMLYLIAGAAIVIVLTRILSHRAWKIPFGGKRVSLVSTLLALLAALHAGIALEWHPVYALYHNTISGGLASAVASGEELPFVGQDDVLRYLHGEAERRGTKLRVRVVGDVNAFRYSYRRLYPGQKKLLEFPLDRGPSWGYHVVDFPSFQKNYPNRWRAEVLRSNAAVKFKYSFGGQVLAKVHRLPLKDLVEPQLFEPEVFSRRTGRLVKADDGTSEIELISGVDTRDFAATGLLMMVGPGKYSMEPQMRLVDSAKGVTDPSGPVVRIDTSSMCGRYVAASELSAEKYRSTPLICDITKERIIRLNIFWLGSHSLGIRGVTLRRLPE